MFAAEDPDVHSDFVNQDDHLWEQDVIEVFIDADGNRRGYIELQVNPRTPTSIPGSSPGGRTATTPSTPG